LKCHVPPSLASFVEKLKFSSSSSSSSSFSHVLVPIWVHIKVFLSQKTIGAQMAAVIHCMVEPTLQ
jgi:hypothetical protein